MNRIVFLDIDGVLNNYNYFIEISEITNIYNRLLDNNKFDLDLKLARKILELDFMKIELLKELQQETNVKYVITSAWRLLSTYPLIEDYLVNRGLYVIGTTEFIDGKRGLEIRDYLENNSVDKFIIIDDERHNDFKELNNYLIKTNFYEGLQEEHIKEAVKLLK